MHEKGPGGELDPARMPGHRLMARLGKRVLRDPAARRRVLAIRAAFGRRAGNLAAIALVARRPAEAAS